ncbi:MAG: DUF3592 domain-containing protein [Tatlockia sp.]|nr:DUF3592 domain-containing protein [Tatlockia sp.]
MLDLIWLFFLSYLLWHFWRDRQLLARARHWLITKGRITHFEWARVGRLLWPKIQYTYQVFEKNYSSEYLFLDTSHNNPNSKYSRLIAYRAAMAYEEDADIDVFYNPNNPQQAALDITMPRKLNIIIGLLCILIIVHLTVVLVHLLKA